MATTVNKAFEEFMKESVNLDSGVVLAARKSRDNLLDNISELSEEGGFFTLCSDFNEHFGSFARRTKCRELDDIDLMIGISGNGATYNGSDPWDNIRIYVSSKDSAQNDCSRDDGTLNSTKVLNKFKKALEGVREYSRSELHRNGEAVVLNLISKDWSFDIVPCFKTAVDDNGNEYYLIPNGSGNWKKTDPRKDREYVSSVNQEKSGRALDLIRLVKKWNKDTNVTTIPSYLLETLVVYFCESSSEELSSYIDFRFRDALKYISSNIGGTIYDMKGIQGSINNISLTDRMAIANKAYDDYQKAISAINYETTQKDMESSISKWGEIFGSDFPEYD